LAAKRALIITYYWPPGGGAGVQRWLKFVKYLHSFGWTPIIYTPSNGEMPVLDESLLHDVPTATQVIRQPIWEPYSIYKRFIGAKKEEKINTGFLSEKGRDGITQRISVWLRGNLFIPDARCFWINPSIRFLSRWLEKNPVDVVISSGPPHSMHLIAKGVSDAKSIPWLADFRDPWTNIDYYRDLKLTRWADRRHHQLEREVVTGADKVVVVGNDMKREFHEKYGVDPVVITNGFDTDDFKDVQPLPPEGYVVSHVGTLVPSRNPVQLWRALGDLVKESPSFAAEFKLRLIGKVDFAIKQSIMEAGLSSHVEYIDYVSHSQVPVHLKSASLLLLVLNDAPNAKGILTGKMFEYLASGRKILCIGPVDGDAASIIDETRSGVTRTFLDYPGIKMTVQEQFENFRSGHGLEQSGGQEKYSRKSLTGDLCRVLNSMIENS
jgi:glycosyltransferase involved in cell wall biosynthesis